MTQVWMSGVQEKKYKYFWDTIYPLVEPLIYRCISDLKWNAASWLRRQIEGPDSNFFYSYQNEEIFNSLVLRLVDVNQARLLKYPLWTVHLEAKDWAKREIQLTSPVELGWDVEQSENGYKGFFLLDNPANLTNYHNYLIYLKWQNQLTLQEIADRTYQCLDTVHLRMKEITRRLNVKETSFSGRYCSPDSSRRRPASCAH